MISQLPPLAGSPKSHFVRWANRKIWRARFALTGGGLFFVGVVGTQLALLSGLWTHEEDDPDPARWLCGPAVAAQGVRVVGVGLMAAGG